MEKKMTKSEFKVACLGIVSELVVSTRDKGSTDAGMVVLLTGGMIVSEISNKLFENENDTLVIITDTEE